MSAVIPFFREAGKGAAIVCIHASASSSGQWALHLKSRLHIKAKVCTRSPFVRISRIGALHQKSFRG